MKGIILAWWSGTRLYPLTIAVSKQLMPIYDKPMIYYPLAVLMQAWIKDILIITTPEDASQFKRLLGDGTQWGIQISYTIQPSPDGLAQAFILWEDFIWNDDVCLILWDNIFFGEWLRKLLEESIDVVTNQKQAVVFWYQVHDPERYWVVAFDDNMNATSLEEKPKNPQSNFAVVWLYFYPNNVIQIAKSITPSERGELEITDVNKKYLQEKTLSVKVMKRGYAWLDTWTHESMIEASNFVHIVQKRQWLKIASPEEIAWRRNRISDEQLLELAHKFKKSGYGEYLLDIYNQRNPMYSKIVP